MSDTTKLCHVMLCLQRCACAGIRRGAAVTLEAYRTLTREGTARLQRVSVSYLINSVKVIFRGRLTCLCSSIGQTRTGGKQDAGILHGGSGTGLNNGSTVP